MTPAAIGIGWQVGVPSGWGTYGVNLALELARRGIAPEIFSIAQRLTLRPEDAAVLDPHLRRQAGNRARVTADAPLALDYPFLHALGDKFAFGGPLTSVHGRPDIALTFFESAQIPADAIEMAKRFAVVVAGSTWNAELMTRQGVANVRNCPQGVDLTLFHPEAAAARRFKGRFVVFAGGKLEYRKGQDLTVAAFKRFHDRHPDALLLAAWHSPWPQAAQSLAASTHVAAPPGLAADGALDVAGWVGANGVPMDAFFDLGRLSNAESAAILGMADVALLPSRCEGGTNLVAMECMACGVPVILSRNTGHLDLMTSDNCYALDLQIPIGAVTGRPDMDGWGESSVEEIVAKLEQAYTDSVDRARRGAAAAAFMRSWGWPEQVGRFLEAIAPFIG